MREHEENPNAEDIHKMSPEEVDALLQELRTYQIELEMQNKELRLAQEELGASHDRYSDLYDRAPVGYLTIDAKGLILEANLTLADTLGVERSALLKQRFTAFICRGDQDVFYQHRRKILNSGQRDTCRLSVLKRNAEPFWVELDSIPAVAGDADPGWLRTVVRDISERVRAEEESQYLKRQVRHAQKLESLGVLAGGIAHDFNNLLTCVLANTEIVLSETSPESAAVPLLRTVVEASEKMAQLAAQMLAYSGRGQVLLQPLDLSTVVREMAGILEVSLDKKVTVVYDLAADLPLIDGDVSQVSQVAMNLVTNASEAVGGRPGVVTLRTGVRECEREYITASEHYVHAEAGSYVFFDVTDTGTGIDEETKITLFDPFFSTKFIGRGLGLSVVLGIVRGHGGAIRIQSEPGTGTSVRVLFPAGASRAGPDNTLERRPGAGTGSEKLDVPGAILVVDDEQVVRDVAREILMRAGCLVETACNGQEALETYRADPDRFALVLLDLTMPEMDGEETYRELKRIRSEVRVVLMSGFSESEGEDDEWREGLSGILQKPFVAAALIEKLRDAFKGD